MTAAARARRLERIKPVLACPWCRVSLSFAADSAACQRCPRRFPIRDHRIFFVEVPARADRFDQLKGRLKRRLGRAYYSVGVQVFAPTYPMNFGQRIRRYVDPASALVVDAGSGNNRLHPEIICVDLFDYDAVDG